MTKVTIRDVAAQAEVSVSVASNALNNKGRVNANTRQRVLQTAQELGYVANYSARRLRGEGGAIGVVLPGTPEGVALERYLSESVHGFTRTAAEYNCKLLQIFYPEETFSESGLYRVLSDGSVDGVIFLAPFLSQMNTIVQVMDRLSRIPYLFFSAKPNLPRVNFIDCDHYAGGQMVVDHLRGQGHTRIAYLMPPNWEDSTNALDLLSGIKQKSAAIDLTLYQYTADRWRESYHLDEILGDGVTAVIAWNDFFALRVIGGLTRRGLRVPQDVAVVGFDNEPFSRWMYPTLTTTSQPLTDMGATAVKFMIDYLRGKAIEPCQRVFQMSMIIRESTILDF